MHYILSMHLQEVAERAASQFAAAARKPAAPHLHQQQQQHSQPSLHSTPEPGYGSLQADANTSEHTPRSPQQLVGASTPANVSAEARQDGNNDPGMVAAAAAAPTAAAAGAQYGTPQPSLRSPAAAAAAAASPPGRHQSLL